mmetsp:Transcript_16630/g.44341  ORF Transcript_16630/g.44341 Transcript_16630/m.44341 type:complete len:213 (+) Transcript_16630:207-845(+)
MGSAPRPRGERLRRRHLRPGNAEPDVLRSRPVRERDAPSGCSDTLKKSPRTSKPASNSRCSTWFSRSAPGMLRYVLRPPGATCACTGGVELGRRASAGARPGAGRPTPGAEPGGPDKDGNLPVSVNVCPKPPPAVRIVAAGVIAAEPPKRELTKPAAPLLRSTFFWIHSRNSSWLMLPVRSASSTLKSFLMWNSLTSCWLSRSTSLKKRLSS